MCNHVVAHADRPPRSRPPRRARARLGADNGPRRARGLARRRRRARARGGRGGGRGGAGRGGGGGGGGGGGREGVVEEVDEGRRIVFTWGEQPSRVIWTLDPVPEGTRFVVTERTLAPVVGPRMAALASRASLCPV